MTIYTKKGDRGMTSLINKASLSKASEIIYLLGSLDEANSYLGIIASGLGEKGLKKIVIEIQKDIFEISSAVAGAKTTFKHDKVDRLEYLLDKNEKEYPPTNNFIRFEDNLSTQLIYARALIRKAERDYVKAFEKFKFKDKKEILKYLNRLSDALFVLAREVNFKSRHKEKRFK